MGVFSKGELPNPLNATERAELVQLEALVTNGVRAFSTAGKALARIRNKQLFRETHNAFEQYVADRWSMSRAHAQRLIDAAAVLENLSPTGTGPLPSSESQARPLAALTPEAQRAAWSEAVEKAPKDASGKPTLTAALVAAAASKRAPRKKRRAGRVRPTRIKVPGATVIVVPNAKFSGSPADALRAAMAKLVSEQTVKAAA